MAKKTRLSINLALGLTRGGRVAHLVHKKEGKWVTLCGYNPSDFPLSVLSGMPFCKFCHKEAGKVFLDSILAFS